MLVLEVNKFYYPDLGGIEHVVQQLAEGLNGARGLEIMVLCCQKNGPTKEETIGGVKVTRASSVGVLRSMPVSFSFFKLFKKYANKADVIDLHHPFPLSFLTYFLFKPKAKLIIHYHSDIVRQNLLGWFLSPLFNFVLRRADRIVVSNPHLAESSKLLNHFKNKCVVVNFGVDIEGIESKIDGRKVENIVEKYGEFVLFVGRLNYYKGVQYLLRAISDTDLKLVIIGEGAERKSLYSLVKKLNIKNQVIFFPPLFKIELINFYKAARLVVLPSIYKSETFGIVLLEAMACGTPVISTELGTGTSYVNQHGITGLVVPPRNVQFLKEALLQIMKNKSERARFGKAARLRAESSFTLAQMIADNAKNILGFDRVIH